MSVGSITHRLSGCLGVFPFGAVGRPQWGGLWLLWPLRPVSEAPGGLSLPPSFSTSTDEMFYSDKGLLLPLQEARHIRKEVWNVPCLGERGVWAGRRNQESGSCWVRVSAALCALVCSPAHSYAVTTTPGVPSPPGTAAERRLEMFSSGISSQYTCGGKG